VRGIVVAMALAAATTLITAVPAHAAAPKNPVAVVKKHMAAGKGVKFVERVTLIEGRKWKILLRAPAHISLELRHREMEADRGLEGFTHASGLHHACKLVRREQHRGCGSSLRHSLQRLEHQIHYHAAPMSR
jgi:hypothetical protein